MSRIEGKISGKGKDPVDAAEILEALAKASESGAEARRDAVSRYLSATEGWQQASDVLGGAFAEREPWLKRKKGE